MSPAIRTGCGVMLTSNVVGPKRKALVIQHPCGQPSVIPQRTALDEFGPYLMTPMCAEHVAKLGRRLQVAS